MQEAFNAIRARSACCLHADIGQVSHCTTLVERAVSRMGRLDVLVNNASSFYPTPLGSLSEAQWEDLMGSNLKGPLFLAGAAAPHLRNSRGCIVNITDIHADHPLRDHPIYCAAKAGLKGLTRSLARDLAPRVRVNAVAPGAVLWPEQNSDPGEEAGIVADTELKRAGEVDDIARAVRYLVMDAPYVTGQILAVDGGRTLGP